MWLPVATLLLLLMVTGNVSCINTKLTTVSDTFDNQNNVALHNVKFDSSNTITQQTIAAANDNDDYNNGDDLKSVADADEPTLQNNEIFPEYLYNANNNNTNFDTAVEISWRNSNKNNSIANGDGQTNDSSQLSISEIAASAFRVLPRHQRAIAAMAEEKGLLQQAAAGDRILRRGKRYLQFAKGSRVSWRTNGKNNILRTNTLWGYGYGFRVNFPFPGPEESRRPFFKRDVLHSLADVLDGHGLDGRACILKSYCTAALDVNSNISGGMLFKMLKLIFTLQEHDKRHLPYLRLENCKQILHSHCPLSFDSISPYTDDV